MADDQLPGTPDNVNEAFFDAMVRHQIGILRLSTGVQKKILEILDASETDLRRQIVDRLAAGRSVSRINTLVGQISALRTQAWQESLEVWRTELLDITKAEPEFVANALRTIAPVQLDLTLPRASLLRSIVRTRPFEGRVLREWARDIARADISRISSAIQIGITQGEAPGVIARRVVGSVSQQGRDGATEVSRRQAVALTRTAVNAFTNQAKREFYKANSDLFKEELYVATLDNRTTPICRSLDGQTFAVGKGPIPPLHFQCRSLRVAMIAAEALGSRPAKPFTQRQLVREYSRANNLRATTRDNLPRGHKGVFDKFQRERIRQLTGTVDSKITYQQWLSRQSATFQDDVLGPTRARLFRRGGLTLDRFVNRRGDQLTLSELAGRESAAFKAAGLSPDEF